MFDFALRRLAQRIGRSPGYGLPGPGPAVAPWVRRRQLLVSLLAAPALPLYAQSANPPAREVLGNGQERIALLLPPQSGEFGRAASAVRAGFRAAFQRAGGGVMVEVNEVDDDVNALRTLYQSFATRNFGVVVGPLTRQGVNTLIDAEVTPVPTLALNQADDRVMPAFMIGFGLSIDNEARQVARIAYADAASQIRDRRPLRAAIISTSQPLSRRAAAAFFDGWRSQSGDVTEPIEIDGRVSDDVRLQVISVQPDVILLALGLEQARAVRTALGRTTITWGTSLLNVTVPAAGGAMRAIRTPELDGVRLVDMPWLLQADHPAVMAYPRLTGNFANVEMQRLYALGIDAFRLAHELAQHKPLIELDGVTGRLRYDTVSDPVHVDRQPVAAEFRDGLPVPLTATLFPAPAAMPASPGAASASPATTGMPAMPGSSPIPPPPPGAPPVMLPPGVFPPAAR